MRLLRWLTIGVLLIGCGGGKLRPAESLVHVATEVQLGDPFVGRRAEATFPITAVGDGSFHVLRVSTASPDLVLDWSPVSLARGATLDVKVSWTPQEPGPLDTTVEVELDLPEAPHHTVQVHGVAHPLPSCDDGNPCTDDAFDQQTDGCVHAPREGSCDDGNACTDEDQCHAGVCVGVAKSCSDGDTCTLDLCDPKSGCTFPPDTRQCDDHDPCTADVCDKNQGCSHPPAADGTNCGEFSCAVAHLCAGGVCRELDITASTEGFPCSDGNVCTQNDHCHAGHCESGVILPTGGPEIVATLDTYGGQNAVTTTDGSLYLFVDNDLGEIARLGNWKDPTTLLVASFDGIALQPRGTLPITAHSAPVAIAPGLFVVPQGDRLQMVNAKAPDMPFVEWESAPPTLQALDIQQVLPAKDGLIVQVRMLSVAMSKLFFVPLQDPQKPGDWVEVYSDSSINDADADGDVVVVANSSSVTWMRLDSNGVVIESRPVPIISVQRLSVQGSTVAVMTTGEIRVVQTDRNNALRAVGTKQGAIDLTLMGETLFGVTPDGTWALTFDELNNGTSGRNPFIDQQGATSIERAPDHVLTSGTLALPLKLASGSVQRITGVGHGTITASTDSLQARVLLGGPTAIGEIDPQAKRFSNWALLPHSPRETEAAILQGETQRVPITTSTIPATVASGTCDGPRWSSSALSGMSSEFQLCGLARATSIALSDGRLWSTTLSDETTPSGPSTRLHLRAWDLSPLNPAPVLDLGDANETQTVAVRATHDQRYVGWVTNVWAGSVWSHLQLIDARSPTAAVVGEYPLESPVANTIWNAGSFAVDEEAALSIIADRIQLHPRQDPARHLPLLVTEGSLPAVYLADANTRRYGNVAWMAHGNAWVGWERMASAASDESRLRLSNIRYDVKKKRLRNLGTLPLPGPLSSVSQLGDYGVVTTPTAVLLVAPGCE